MTVRYLTALLTVSLVGAFAGLVSAADQVKTANGLVEGADDNGVRAFKGIPFAAPPVGDLRWKPPQPCTGLERRALGRAVRPEVHAAGSRSGTCRSGPTA